MTAFQIIVVGLLVMSLIVFTKAWKRRSERNRVQRIKQYQQKLEARKARANMEEWFIK